MGVLGYLMGVLGYLMGVLGYLMGVLGCLMAKWRLGPIECRGPGGPGVGPPFRGPVQVPAAFFAPSATWP